jgi:ankyrin repeat protein
MYKTHAYFLRRVEELREHAKATGHQKAFQKALDAGDAEGKTLLIHAAIKNNIPLADFLIKNGVDVNLLTNRGGSAHHFASKHSDKTLVGKLIDAGAKYEDGYGVEEPLPEKYTVGDYMYIWRAAVNLIMLDSRINDMHMRDMRINDMHMRDIEYEFKINDKDLPKKKKRAHDEKLAKPPPHMKASLFKKQFGRK